MSVRAKKKQSESDRPRSHSVFSSLGRTRKHSSIAQKRPDLTVMRLNNVVNVRAVKESEVDSIDAFPADKIRRNIRKSSHPKKKTPSEG